MPALKNMKQIFVVMIVVSGLFFILLNHKNAVSEEKKICIDKQLCGLMLRAGKESFDRGKYEISLSYFKKAIQADSTSSKAWHWYNVTISYAFAEKSRKMSYPEFKNPKTEPGGKSPESVPAQNEQTPVIEDDEDEDMEGC